MLNRLKISLILAPLALTFMIGVYIYSLWAQERDLKAEAPFDASAALSRDLFKFHQKRGSFPENLEELEGVVWEKKPRNFASAGRALIHRNYYYLYTLEDHHRYALWAIPMGKAREEAPTLFLTADPFTNRTWKGPAVPLTELKNLSTTPTSHELGILGLIEQQKPQNRIVK